MHQPRDEIVKEQENLAKSLNDELSNLTKKVRSSPSTSVLQPARRNRGLALADLASLDEHEH